MQQRGWARLQKPGCLCKALLLKRTECLLCVDRYCATDAPDQSSIPLQAQVRCWDEAADGRVKCRWADHGAVSFIHVLFVPQSVNAVSWKLHHIAVTPCRWLGLLTISQTHSSLSSSLSSSSVVISLGLAPLHQLLFHAFLSGSIWFCLT